MTMQIRVSYFPHDQIWVYYPVDANVRFDDTVSADAYTEEDAALSQVLENVKQIYGPNAEIFYEFTEV
jgi:hypothetical protein